MGKKKKLPLEVAKKVADTQTFYKVRKRVHAAYLGLALAAGGGGYLSVPDLADEAQDIITKMDYYYGSLVEFHNVIELKKQGKKIEGYNAFATIVDRQKLKTLKERIDELTKKVGE
jgi:hypothetical protein